MDGADGDRPSHLVFAGDQLLAAGDLATVAGFAHENLAGERTLLLFETATGRQIDLDLSGTRAEVEGRYGSPSALSPQAPARRGRGRPRLGVVGREVTLLPRHWEWLDGQRGGASAALRRLVDQARRDHVDADLVRVAQDRANRFISAMAGNLPGFEEATRALYSGDHARYVKETDRWPPDIRRHAREFAQEAFR